MKTITNNTDKNKFNPTQYLSSGLSEQQIISIKNDFDKLDTAKINSLSPKQIKDIVQSKGVEAKAKGIYQLVSDLDSQGSGNITFQQFLHLNTPRLVPNDSFYNISLIFKLFDDQKTGYISVKSLRRKAQQLGLQIQSQDLQDMIKIADQNKDGLVSEQQFYHFMSMANSL